MNDELRYDGVLYLEMRDGETKEEAENRLLDLFSSAGICPSAYDTSVTKY